MQPSDHVSAATQAALPTPNPGYVLGQLARALTTSQSHESPETRARANRKVEAWLDVFQGMLRGSLQIGSRTPVDRVPAWATLEVVQGGFATGGLLAGGDLQTHERELLARLPAVAEGAERAALNAYYLGEEGLRELTAMLVSGCYRIHVPEEGALLVVVWLIAQGHADRARRLLDGISPFFSRLRFYPAPDPVPLTESSVVHLQDVAQTVAELRTIQPSARVMQQKEAIEVWQPLYDRVVSLFLETVEGNLPSLVVGTDGKPLRSETGKFHIEGGWPCQVYPRGWKVRARTLLREYETLRAQHQLCPSAESRTGGFPTLRRYLERCVTAPKDLTGRDVGMIRSILAGLLTSHGQPGSERWQAKHDRQAGQSAAPTRADLARVLIDRLSAYPAGQGVPSLEEVLRPVSTKEGARHRVPEGQEILQGLATRVRRCLDAPVETLVEMGIIPSSEVLAQVMPQITSQVRAAGISDPDLRRLYSAIYAAFRRRRSLLLLNLESQVKLHELPWVAAINVHRQESVTTKEQSRLVLEQLAYLAVTGFPQQIVPNKLVQELRSLASAAGLDMPFVDELAADIFMGALAEHFLLAAQQAGKLLQGTLYEHYYGLPYDRVTRMKATRSMLFGKRHARTLMQLCVDLAGGSSPSRGWSVANNGKIIEQEQILTTHNLATLFGTLGLNKGLSERLEELAFRCFRWVCQRLQRLNGPWKTRLQTVKNSAYAWRQMVFFLTMAPTGAVKSFLMRAQAHLREQPPAFQDRFRPALEGLARAARGLSVETEPTPKLPSGSRRFLGWTTERHWLLA